MIRVDGLNKRFRLYRKPADRLWEIFTGRRRHVEYNALRDVTFHVDEGETVGIIGRNGAGKSTLLKIMSGVLLPDSGQVDIEGKITGLLELGTGFNMELSGRENIYLNGLLLGMGRPEVNEKINDIVAFSELGDFIDEPMKTYSSGMIMRLGFSVAIHAEPKCFVVDEALSVGDAAFQQKCMRRMKEFKANGGSIVFVSHDLGAVKMLCDRAVLMKDGEIIVEGTPDDVVNKYNFLIAKDLDEQDRVMSTHDPSEGYGNRDIEILDVSVKGQLSESSHLSAGEAGSITVVFSSKIDIDDVTVGILVRDKYGQDIFGTNSNLMGKSIPVNSGGRYECSFTMPMDIGLGKYTVTTAVHSDEEHTKDCYHWIDAAATFEVEGIHGDRFVGVCKLHPDLEVSETS